MSGYWSSPQRPGENFQVGELEGYFNDLRHKADWDGRTTEEGIPIQGPSEDESFIFPITVFQKALGHWDHSYEQRPEHHLSEFRTIARWAVDNQDDSGGWPCWVSGEEVMNPYSSMAQGQAASVLSRAYDLTGDPVLKKSAEDAIELMLKDIEDGGTARRKDGHLYLEEYPRRSDRTVLNGWIFSIYGLYDYLISNENHRFRQALYETVESLSRNLDRFDKGYWSHYDLEGNTALPFYHDLHVNQLSVLQRTFSEHSNAFKRMADQWEAHQERRLNLLRATLDKAIEKFIEPPDIRR